MGDRTRYELPAFDDDVWELYDTNTDWTQAKDLAKEHPQKLHELQRLWLIEAVKYNVLPLDDRFAERANPEIAGRPQLIKGTRQMLFGGMGRLTESSIVNMKNKSHAVTAEVIVPRVRRGRRHRRPGRDHRRLEPLRQGWQAEVLLQLLRPATGTPSRARRRSRRVRTRCGWSSRTTAAAGEGRHGHALHRRQAKAGEGRVEQTEPMSSPPTRPVTSAFEFGSPVTDDYPARRHEVQRRSELGRDRPRQSAEDLDHLISPEERLHVAMALQ